MTTQVAGYTYGTNDVARSPLTLEDLNLLKQTVLFTEDDEISPLSWRSVGRPNDAILDTHLAHLTALQTIN